jgi:hypothetical protein
MKQPYSKEAVAAFLSALEPEDQQKVAGIVSLMNRQLGEWVNRPALYKEAKQKARLQSAMNKKASFDKEGGITDLTTSALSLLLLGLPAASLVAAGKAGDYVGQTVANVKASTLPKDREIQAMSEADAYRQAILAVQARNDLKKQMQKAKPVSSRPLF